jgi:hypothetical protein
MDRHVSAWLLHRAVKAAGWVLGSAGQRPSPLARSSHIVSRHSSAAGHTPPLASNAHQRRSIWLNHAVLHKFTAENAPKSPRRLMTSHGASASITTRTISEHVILGTPIHHSIRTSDATSAALHLGSTRSSTSSMLALCTRNMMVPPSSPTSPRSLFDMV